MVCVRWNKKKINSIKMLFSVEYNGRQTLRRLLLFSVLRPTDAAQRFLLDFTKWPPLPTSMDNRRHRSILFNVGTRRRTRPHLALCVATSPHHTPPAYTRGCGSVVARASHHCVYESRVCCALFICCVLRSNIFIQTLR